MVTQHSCIGICLYMNFCPRYCINSKVAKSDFFHNTLALRSHFVLNTKEWSFDLQLQNEGLTLLWMLYRHADNINLGGFLWQGVKGYDFVFCLWLTSFSETFDDRHEDRQPHVGGVVETIENGKGKIAAWSSIPQQKLKVHIRKNLINTDKVKDVFVNLINFTELSLLFQNILHWEMFQNTGKCPKLIPTDLQYSVTMLSDCMLITGKHINKSYNINTRHQLTYM